MAIIKPNNNTLSGITALPAAISTGKVLQVVTATDTTFRETTSTSFVTASNTLSVNITPASSSNKIFVIVTSISETASGRGYFTIYRDSTNLGTSTGITENRLTWNPLSMSTLDSPSSTSQLTYQVYFRNLTGTVYLNNGNTGRITAFEIEG